MTQNGTNGTGRLGNTNKRPQKCRGYVFTINNYTDCMINGTIEFCKKSGQYLFEKEIGTNGTPHLQGFLYCKNPISFNTVKKNLPTAHIEKMKGSLKQNIAYCTKDAGDDNVFTNIKLRSPIKNPLKNVKLHNWQNDILELIKTEPDNRTINWYVDYVGNLGKTTLAKHICLTYADETLYVSGKNNDIKYGVSEFIKRNDLRVCIFDFTRTLEKFISYEAIESVKNGIFFNNKYESKMCIFNSPHIICFSNFYPDVDKLSADRWNIVELNKEIDFSGDDSE